LCHDGTDGEGRPLQPPPSGDAEPAREVLVSFEADEAPGGRPAYAEALAMRTDPRRAAAPPITPEQAEELEGAPAAGYEIGPEHLEALPGEPTDVTPDPEELPTTRPRRRSWTLGRGGTPPASRPAPGYP